MTQLLLKENCTVTITHSRTKDLKAECLGADIIVAAVGIPELVKGDWVKKDTIVIDVGINKTDNCLLYTSPSPRDGLLSRMPSSA